MLIKMPAKMKPEIQKLFRELKDDTQYSYAKILLESLKRYKQKRRV